VISAIKDNNLFVKAISHLEKDLRLYTCLIPTKPANLHYLYQISINDNSIKIVKPPFSLFVEAFTG
jgi:hypothetical protein